MSATVSLPCSISSAGMLSTPTTLPLFSARIPASTSWRRIRWSSSFVDSCQVRTMGSPLIWWLWSSEQYSVHQPIISCTSVRHFPCLSWTVLALDCLCFMRFFLTWKAPLLLFLRRFLLSLCTVFVSSLLLPLSCLS